jgi:transposase
MTIDSRSLYAGLLGLTAPWEITDVEMKLKEGEVHIRVALPGGERWVCPECHSPAPIYDHQERVWRHLDTCQFKTLVHARVPRLSCPTHGIRQLQVPWAEPGSQFTALFEALAIDWLGQASVKAVAKQLRISWDEAAGIQARAVRRGLERRKLEAPRYAGVDETSFQKRHQYVTVVSDLERGCVLHVADERGQEALDEFWTQLSPAQLGKIEAVAMDMWEPYIRSTRAHLPGADGKIVFDKFHVAQHLGNAVDKVRRQEHRARMAEGDPILKGTKYLWLENPKGRTWSESRAFNLLREIVTRVGRAWALREAAMSLWSLRYAGAADRDFRGWYGWARRSRLEPMREVAGMLKRHWANIRTYFAHRITNAGSESMNARIQSVKRRACGFRNRVRFKVAIYFHCGGLELYPATLRSGQ